MGRLVEKPERARDVRAERSSASPRHCGRRTSPPEPPEQAQEAGEGASRNHRRGRIGCLNGVLLGLTDHLPLPLLVLALLQILKTGENVSVWKAWTDLDYKPPDFSGLNSTLRAFFDALGFFETGQSVRRRSISASEYTHVLGELVVTSVHTHVMAVTVGTHERHGRVVLLRSGNGFVIIADRLDIPCERHGENECREASPSKRRRTTKQDHRAGVF